MWGGVGHAAVGWDGLCRGGVRWVMKNIENIKLLVLQGI